MDKALFWKLIDDARREAGPDKTQPKPSLGVVSSISQWFLRLSGAGLTVPDAQRSNDISVVLIDRLASMEVGEIMRWQQIFQAYQKMSYKNKLWAAAYVINGGCSDDGFDYFRGWLTAQGKEVFLRALADPDSLVEVDVEMDAAFDEAMLAVGYEAYFKKMAMQPRDYAKARAAYDEHALTKSQLQNLAADIRYAPDIDVQWEEDNLKSVVPALCAKYG